MRVLFLPRKSRFGISVALSCLLLVGITLVGWYSGWIERSAYRVMIAMAGEGERRLGLSDYRVGIDALPLAGIGDNASGLTYHPGRNSLFSVINRPPQIVELTLDGALKRTMAVEGVADLEGITHVRGNEFFIADERTQQLIHVEIGDDQTAIDARGRPRIGLAFDLASNLGFEGVSWDHTRERLFVVKEKQPLRLFELSGLSAALDGRRLDLQIREWFPRGSASFLLRDLSSLTYHEDSGNMLLLSDESRLVVELDGERQPSGLLVLRKGRHGLKRDVPQAEGIAVGPRGEIYLISEPNLFYRFDPPPR